jgi:hypothetical protein
MYHKPPQFIGHGRLLNVIFGSSQTEHWLPKYGHFKFRGIEAFQKKFTRGFLAAYMLE